MINSCQVAHFWDPRIYLSVISRSFPRCIYSEVLSFFIATDSSFSIKTQKTYVGPFSSFFPLYLTKGGVYFLYTHILLLHFHHCFWFKKHSYQFCKKSFLPYIWWILEMCKGGKQLNWQNFEANIRLVRRGLKSCLLIWNDPT